MPQSRRSPIWFREQPDAVAAAKPRAYLDSAPGVPEGLLPKLLSKMFDDSDPKGQRSSRLLTDVAHGVTKSRALFESAAQVLADGTRLPPEAMDEARRLAEKRHLSEQFLSADIGLSMEAVRRLEKAVESFEAASRVACPAYAPLGASALDAFITASESPFVSGLSSFRIGAVSERAASVLAAIESLSGALSRIEAIATRRSLPFDSRPVPWRNCPIRTASPAWQRAFSWMKQSWRRRGVTPPSSCRISVLQKWHG